MPEPKRLIVDTGSLVKSDGEQDLIKYSIILRAFDLLGYDLVSLSEKDIETGHNLGLLDGSGSVFDIISPHKTGGPDLPAKFTKSLALDGGDVDVTVAAFDPTSAPKERIAELFTPQPGRRAVGILILNRCDPEIIDFIARRVSAVHCVVCPSESDEPMLIGEEGDRPLVFSVGRYGRHVCELQIRAGRTGGNISAGRGRSEWGPMTDKTPRLSIAEIKQWVKAHFDRTGKWPGRDSGPVIGGPDISWSTVDR